MRVSAGVAVAAGIAVGLPVCLVVALQTLTRDTPTLLPMVEPVVVEIASGSDDSSQVVFVAGKFVEPEVLRTPVRTGGVVTAVHVEPGDTLHSLDPVISIDGATRVAYHSTAPFWRTIGSRTSGEDVFTLQDLLATAGYLDSSAIDGRYGGLTASAVRRFASDLGATSVSEFDPAWVVWLPDPSFEVGRIDLQIGDLIASSGTPIAGGLDSLIGVSITDSEGRTTDLSGYPDPVLTIEETDLAIDAGDPLGSIVQDESVVEHLRVAGDELIAGQLRRATAVEFYSVPASAVVAVEDHYCVWLAPTADDDFVALKVNPTQSTPGVAHLLGPKPADTRFVLANPREILDDPRC